MRYLLLIVLPWLAILLQSTLWHHWSIYGIVPDLLLVLVISQALVAGVKQGTAYGFACGLLEDFYLGRFWGINALAKGISAFVVGKMQVMVFKDNILTGLLGVMIGSLINAVILFLLAWLNLPMMAGKMVLAKQLVGQVLYNTLISIPVYIWFYRTSVLRDGEIG